METHRVSPSRDVLIAGQQHATRDWWQRQRSVFRRITSDETIAEASRGDATQAALRLAALCDLPRVPVTVEAEALAEELLGTGAPPSTVRSDALHLALANAQILRKLERESLRRGWNLPTVCTPLELMEGEEDAIESDT